MTQINHPHERRVVAYREMGHAIVATALPGMDPVHKVSIIPRGVGALGYTLQRPTEDRSDVVTSSRTGWPSCRAATPRVPFALPCAGASSPLPLTWINDTGEGRG